MFDRWGAERRVKSEALKLEASIRAANPLASRAFNDWQGKPIVKSLTVALPSLCLWRVSDESLRRNRKRDR